MSSISFITRAVAVLALICATFAPVTVAANGRISVTLDPGHGGIDPGAEAGGMNEADLMLSFARRLKEELLRAGRFDVTLTRTEDVFVALEARMTIARAAGADVFVSLHADALPDDAGQAAGLAVYTLSEDVAAVAALRLAADAWSERAARAIVSALALWADEETVRKASR